MQQEPPSADQAATTSQPATEQLGEDTQYCRRILLGLVEIGNEIAALIGRQALSQADDPAAAQKSAAAYNKVAQSVRRSIMLHDKLGKPAKARANRTAARKKIIRDVEDAIQSKAPRDEQETLHAELLERLDSPDLEDDIANRPIAEIIIDLCRDLGLGIDAVPDTNPWKRRTLHDIAILNARAEQLPGRAHSEKLAALLAKAPPPPAKRSDPPPIAPDMDIITLMKMLGRLPDP